MKCTLQSKQKSIVTYAYHQKKKKPFLVSPGITFRLQTP